jgi:iron complex transport system substrate-binding protein
VRPFGAPDLFPILKASSALAACAVLGAALPSRAEPPRRVLSVDQCADQYVLALADRSTIVGLSRLATGPDSFLRDEARGLPARRATLESALAARPQLVVRSWTPNVRLLPALEARGVAAVQLEDATDFEGVRRNIRAVAAALGRAPGGERLIGRMDAKLARAKGAWQGRRALYLTPDGYTAGPGTMTDAILSAAGLTNAAAAPGFQAVPLEALVQHPPEAVVLAFFDAQHMSHWAVGRRPVLQRLVQGRTIATPPSDLSLCPAWFSADAALRIAAAASSGR